MPAVTRASPARPVSAGTGRHSTACPTTGSCLPGFTTTSAASTAPKGETPMARKKAAHTSAEESGATATLPEPAPAPATPAPEPPPPVSDTNDNAERRPDKVFTYLIQRDTYVQVSVWERLVNLRNGGHFVAYDISLRK